MIHDFNLNKELETLKDQFLKDEINLNSLIIKLIMIEDVIS